MEEDYNDEEQSSSQNESVNLSEEENKQTEMTEELKHLIKKLHQFAKLQIAKMNHEAGVVSDNINRQLMKFMRRSLKVIVLKHQESIESPMQLRDKDFQNNIEQMVDKLDSEIRERETDRISRASCQNMDRDERNKRRASDPLAFDFSKELLVTLSLNELSVLLCCLLPIARLSNNKYMIGTEAKLIVVKSDKVMLRTGGGYAPLDEHINKYALFECLLIWRTMNKQKIGFTETVVNLLEMHGAD